MEMETTIGLEIHAELKTRTKMFCDSLNAPHDSEPNTHICPVCMAHPGALPVINREAVKHVLRVGLALKGTLADYTEFDRKNYFYPDLPKGYQISQYKYPLVSGGELQDVAITRIHLEEDTARSQHASGEHSLIDFNRAGVPLMELVTEPVVKSAEQAGAFARELQLLLRTLGVSDANMERGEMRVEANISVAPHGERGTKVEVKNLNSFRSVERAIEFEVERQKKLIAEGGEVIQETRGWDELKGVTFSQRIKESSEDYRYFPDPDLPKLMLSEIPEFSKEALESSMPELPWERKERYEALGIKKSDAEIIVRDPRYSEFFENIVVSRFNQEKKTIQTASNYFVSDVLGLLASDGTLLLSNLKEGFADVIKMLSEGEISSRGAKDLIRVLLEQGGSARSHAEALDIFQKSDPAELEQLTEAVVAENPEAVAEYQSGKDAALQFLVGQGMKKSKGSANPALLRGVLEEKLKKAN